MEALAGVRPYAVPRSARPIRWRLDGSEGVPSPRGDLAMRARDVRQYPQPAAFEARLARRLGVDPSQVLVTAGADDALDRVCRAYLAPGRRLVLPAPTFEMIGRYAKLCGADVVQPEWTGGWPSEAVLRVPDPAVIAAVTPNNPTGAVIGAEALRSVASARPDALLLVDLAYGAFADVDLLPTVLRLPSALAVGSLSKSWSLPGLRIGWAVGDPAVIAVLRAAGQPYAVSTPSLALAAAALEADPGFLQRHIAQVRTERAELTSLLRAAACAVPDSQANFVFARVPDARALFDAMAGHGIAIRHWPDSASLGDAVRITCPGDASVFAQLRAALVAVLEISA